MVDEFNARRHADDQIPIACMSFRDWTWFIEHYGLFGEFRLWREYRLTFPNSRLWAQWIACVISMFGLGLLALVWFRLFAPDL